SEEPVFDQSREVIIALDLSRSMLTQDVKPSRLNRAKLLIQSLLDQLAGERVGLVLFSGTAFLQSPLSADYEILREFLPTLSPDYLPEGGTNYQAMLETTLGAFSSGADADRFLIVLSDGEALDEDWQKLIPRLKERNIRVLGLGVGTAAGGVIPDSNGGLIKDERGAAVLSKLEPATLQRLAETTGGVYSDASAWVDLAKLLRATVDAGRKGEFREKSQVRLIERYQWVLAPAILCLLLSFWHEFPISPKARELPLAKKMSNTNSASKSAAVAAALTLILALGPLVAGTFAAAAIMPPAVAPPGAATARTPAPASGDAFAEPLTKLVTELAAKPTPGAHDYSELANTTLTYGQRKMSSQERFPPSVIKDALAGVDAGEALDPKAANWAKQRSDLQNLLKQAEQPPQQNQQKQDKDQKDQKQDKKDQQDKNKSQKDQKSDQKDQDKKENNPSSDPSEKQDKDDKSGEQKTGDQKPTPSDQSAFGDMKEDQKPPAPQPQKQPEEMQKVGGAQNNPDQERAENPSLALPLQKLDQVRDQDSPAKLFQIMEGQKKTPAKKGRDW
ncbi:MAG TPA: VWA domain-containing protein, partial [Opitutaceae bacterium]|nr:VWA domain-containing protein [Opitutaceae bacterium]